MAVITINTDASRAYVEQLKRMHKSALPVAIRSALNSAAFDVKKNTMPESAKKAFIERKPSFFKANSKVKPATGFDVNSMQSTVGFVKIAGKGNTVEDLEQQESGGKIAGRSFIALKEARVGNSWNKNVRNNTRITGINKIVDSRKANGKNSEEKFIKSAIHAGKGGWVLGNRTNGKGNKMLWSIRSIMRSKKGTKIKSVRMFAVKSNRNVDIKKPTDFMKNASNISAKIVKAKFIEAAKKQIEKIR